LAGWHLLLLVLHVEIPNPLQGEKAHFLPAL